MEELDFNTLCFEEIDGETVLDDYDLITVEVEKGADQSVIDAAVAAEIDEGCRLPAGMMENIGAWWDQSLWHRLWDELVTVTLAVVSAIPFFLAYIAIILAFMFAWYAIKPFLTPKRDYSSLKTVTFGDESAVTSNSVASVISVLFIFLAWTSFTGSKLIPSFLHVPGPYTGEGRFEITVDDGTGGVDTSTVAWRVDAQPEGADPEAEPVPIEPPEIEPGEGSALNDSLLIQEYRSGQLNWDDNDAVSRSDGAAITRINGQDVTGDGGPYAIDNGTVTLTRRGAMLITPYEGWQMEPIWLPPPEAVFEKFISISRDGFRNVLLNEHLAFSLFRVVIGFLLGTLVGIPMGYAMGLSNWFRGWFDPIVEFMRPVPPLALIPLVIIWAGIGEVAKIILLFLAALWIMAIAARAGVSGVRITKVHAAYSLGASKWQIMRHVIIPNSLPEIFTGARVAMGVCWGTVVAAELVAAQRGAGFMISAAADFQATDVVIMGIIMIGVIGFGIDILVRWAERKLVPWKGHS